MSNLDRDKSDYMQQYTKARNEKYKTRYTTVSSHNKGISVSDHPRGKQLEKEIKTCDKIITALERSEDTRDTRRIIVGLEAYQAKCAYELHALEIKIEAGQKLDYDGAGNVANSEKKTIKATRQRLKNTAKYYKSSMKERGKNKDASGVKVGKYLGSEVSLARNLCSKYADHSIGQLEISEMMKAQRSVNSQISNKEAYGMDL